MEEPEPILVYDRRSHADHPGADSRLAAPVTTTLSGTSRIQRYIRITDTHGRQNVTVIEVLTPASKNMRRGGEAYRFKRKQYLAERINFVEIDLLRSGYRPPLGDPAPPITDYYVLVSPAEEFPRLGVWPIGLRDTLPLIPIPLETDVPAIAVDLRCCLDQVHDEGRYADQSRLFEAARPAAPRTRCDMGS